MKKQSNSGKGKHRDNRLSVAAQKQRDSENINRSKKKS
ncbi:small EDRK-rich factor 2-like [Notamacropus eugenii]